MLLVTGICFLASNKKRAKSKEIRTVKYVRLKQIMPQAFGCSELIHCFFCCGILLNFVSTLSENRVRAGPAVSVWGGGLRARTRFSRRDVEHKPYVHVAPKPVYLIFKQSMQAVFFWAYRHSARDQVR